MSLVSCYPSFPDPQLGSPYPRLASFSIDIGGPCRSCCVVKKDRWHVFRSTTTSVVETCLSSTSFLRSVALFFTPTRPAISTASKASSPTKASCLEVWNTLLTPTAISASHAGGQIGLRFPQSPWPRPRSQIRSRIWARSYVGPNLECGHDRCSIGSDLESDLTSEPTSSSDLVTSLAEQELALAGQSSRVASGDPRSILQVSPDNSPVMDSEDLSHLNEMLDRIQNL